MRIPSLKHGRRGCATCSTVLPTRQRDPITRSSSVEPAHGEVLAERRRVDRTPELARPPVVVLDRVRVHRLVGTTVDATVGLVVAVEVHAPHRDPARDRRLPDPGRDRPPVPLDRCAPAHVHRDHRPRRGSLHGQPG